MKNIKPYDVIELIEQRDWDNKTTDKKLEDEIFSKIKNARYNKSVDNFINCIEQGLENVEEDEEELE